jgi:amidohydrolase
MTFRSVLLSSLHLNKRILMNQQRLFSFCPALLIAATLGAQQRSSLAAEVDGVYPRSETLYRELHKSPELSSHETATAAKLANELQQIGFQVTTGVGGTGVVGILKNGAGPVAMLRTELDALPVLENTGLPFASTVRTKDDAGLDVPVMHACGHDAHMAAWTGTARIMAADRTKWSGTLIVIGQPAEETGAGAKAMVADGLLTRFPRPDFAIAVHDDSRRPSGEVGLHAGPILTNADALTIHIFGRGGHGARPEATIDPIVIAARTVVALQTIVAREVSPFDPAVITVGSIHGGTKNNIIPDEVVLQLTVRSFTDAVRQQLLRAIDRIVKAEAMAGGATRAPTIDRIVTADALVNDSALARRLSPVLMKEFGREHSVDVPPEMAGEDFSVFPLAGIPSVMLRIGAVEPAKYAAAMKSGAPLPSLHSSQFAPDAEATIKTAMMAEVLSLRELMPARRK